MVMRDLSNEIERYLENMEAVEFSETERTLDEARHHAVRLRRWLVDLVYLLELESASATDSLPSHTR